VGTWIQSVALGWYVYDLTRSASSLGLVSFAAYAPSLLIGLVAGAVADRADHKSLLVLTQINTTLQVRANDAMRGRIMSMLTLSFFGLSTLGSLALGTLGDRIGIEAALRTGGGAILALLAIVTLRSPAIFAAVKTVETAPRTPVR
ncbi:MAG: MFS transporter, partial [Candidatus Binatia bacterium]